MTKDEALKLALDALEDIFGKNKVDVTVINVIKEALAQPAQEPDAQITVEHYSSDFENITVDFCNLEKGVHLLYTTPPQRKLLTDEKICLIAHNTDHDDWDSLTFKKCWHEGFKAGFREAEIEHNIKG